MIPKIPCRLHGQPKHNLSISMYPSVLKIPAGEWDQCLYRQSIFLDRDYLTAIEFSGIPVCYVIFRCGDTPVGIAAFQVANFTGAPLASYLQFQCSLIELVTRPLKFIKSPIFSKVVVCGSPYAAGEHGYAFSKDVPPQTAAAALGEAATKAKAQLDKTSLTAGVLLKEFYPDSQPLLEILGQNRYAQFHTEPAMVLPIDPKWNGFEDYLASLASKYRVKAKRAYTLSSSLRCRDLTLDDIVTYKKRMEELYRAVAAKAEFRLGELEMNTLFDLRQRLHSQFILKGYFLQSKLVGFSMGFVNGDTLDAGLVGIDYDLNKSHAIYSRMLYDYLQWALQNKLGMVNYGRTAGEIKSTLGAVPIPLSCCLHLGNTTLDAVLPLFVNTVRPKEFSLRKPFKKTWYALNQNRNMPPLSLGHFPARALAQNTFQPESNGVG